MDLHVNIKVVYDNASLKEGYVEDMAIHLKNHLDSLIDNGSIDLAPYTTAVIDEYSLEVTHGS